MFSFKYFFAFILFILSGLTLAQTNSVQLKNGNGNLISAHASITAAYTAIPQEISQPYLIEILSSYNGSSEVFPIQITAKSGSSAENTITLRPAAGNNQAVITKALNNNPIINLNGVKYFVIDGRPGGIGDTTSLVIENTLAVGSKTNTINFIDGASNNTVKYVIAKSVPRSNAGPRNILFSSSNSSFQTANNLIENCEVVGGRSGIGFSGISSGLNSGNIIRNTRIYNFGYAGVWLVSAAANTTIENCKIYQEESGISTAVVAGIILNTGAASGTTNIRNNRLYSLKHNSTDINARVTGISGSGADGSTLNIVNNFIALSDDNQSTSFTHGIYISDSTAFTCNIIFNSVRISGTQTDGLENEIISSGISKVSLNPAAVFNISNNLFINSRQGGTGYHVGGNYNSLAGILNINFNSYFTESPSPSFHAVWGSVFANGLNDYRSTAYPNEQNSIFKNVEFVSATDLHLTGNSIGDFDLAGMPVQDISVDIDYTVRHNEYPYKGAAEAEALPVELSSFTASVSGNNVNLTWVTQTEVNNSGFEIQRRSLSGSWITVQFVKGAGTTTDAQFYTFTDRELAAGSYNYRLKQIDLGGISTIYNLSETVEVMNPFGFSLEQNYPNPFNPSTVIKYSLPIDGHVTLTVYNMLGEEAAVLINNVVQAGEHEVNFNAAGLSSGTYIYRLDTGNYSSSKKMVLIK